MVVIDVQNIQRRFSIDEIPLGEWASRAIELLGRQDAALSVVVVANGQIRDIHNEAQCCLGRIGLFGNFLGQPLIDIKISK